MDETPSLMKSMQSLHAIALALTVLSGNVKVNLEKWSMTVRTWECPLAVIGSGLMRSMVRISQEHVEMMG